MAKRCDRCKQAWPGHMWYCPDCGIVLDKPDPEKAKNSEQLTIDDAGAGDEVFTVVPGTEDLLENW